MLALPLPSELQHLSCGIMLGKAADCSGRGNPELPQWVAPLRQIVVIVDKHISMLDAKRRRVRIVDSSHNTRSQKREATPSPAPFVSEDESTECLHGCNDCKRKFPLTVDFCVVRESMCEQSSERMAA